MRLSPIAKISAGRHYEVSVLNVVGQVILPACRYIHAVWRNAREVVPERVVLMLRIAVGYRLACLRLILRYAVQIHDAIAKVDPIAG